MVLTKTGGNPLAIGGPGEIWQDEDGVLQFKIFISRAACQGLQAYMARPGVIGQLIPDEDYFRLEAQEYSLPIWTAQNVLPSPRIGPAGGFAMAISANLSTQKHILQIRNLTLLRSAFAESWSFPATKALRQ